MASEELVKAVREYNNFAAIHGVDESLIAAYIQAVRVAMTAEDDIPYGLELAKDAKGMISEYCFEKTEGSIWELEEYGQRIGETYSLVDSYYSVLLFEAPHVFESFMLYMDKKRPVKERFYQPRMGTLYEVARGIQALADDDIDELIVDLPPRTGKTTIVKLGQLWYGSQNPELSNLYSAFSDKITRAYYNGLQEFMTDPTYTYSEIYPEYTKFHTNGDDETIDINRRRTYPTFTARSIHGTLNGACDCSGLAVADDLFSGIEEAVSEERQTSVWLLFDNNFMSRLKGRKKLINMGTRWALKDCIGRRLELLKNSPEYEGRSYREVIIPALNADDESNFDYPYGVGFSTTDYRRARASFEANEDMASWFAQYQQQPIERLGALFAPEAMRFFMRADLPQRIPDKIFAAVDPAYGGGDFVAMPICEQYEDEYYVVDVVYNDGDKDVTRPAIVERMTKLLERHDFSKTAEVHFEDTRTTAEFREWCAAEWKKAGVPVNVTHSPAYNRVSKEDRILNHAPDIRRLRFLEGSERTREYNRFMQNVYSFTIEGNNKHDDAPDSLGQLCDMIYSRRARQAHVMKSLF